jgi:hypothetical protein
MLFLLIVPLMWMIINSRSRRGSSLVKAPCLCALILAACKTKLVRRSTISVTVLADTSSFCGWLNTGRRYPRTGSASRRPERDDPNRGIGRAREGQLLGD